MSEPESQFPTIFDLYDGLRKLVNDGLGALPVQVLVVPDSTMQAIARLCGHSGEKPVLAIELNYGDTTRIPVTLMSADRMATSVTQ